MTIKLDWQIDDVEAGDPAGEDHPAGPPGRPRLAWYRSRWVLLAVALVASAAAGGAGWLAWTVRQNRVQAETELRQALQFEARAYGTNDSEIFMSLQDPQDTSWRNRQSTAFSQRANWPADLPYTYTFRVVATEIDAENAWAEVEETLPERLPDYMFPPTQDSLPLVAYRRVLFYRHLPGGWVHVAPQATSPYWGETRVQVRGRYRVQYLAGDEHAVQSWLDTLVPLSDRLCSDLGCPDDLRWTLAVTYTAPLDDFEFGRWITDTVAFPVLSPALTGFRADGQIDGNTGTQLVANTFLAVLRSAGGQSMFEANYETTYALVARGVIFWEILDAHRAMPSPAVERLAGDMRIDLDESLHLLFAREAGAGVAHYIPLHDLGNPTASPPIGNRDDTAQIYSLVDYVAAAYGRERLGALLRAAGRADSVGAALQAALALPDLPAFEQGWLAYGRRTYGQ